MMKWIGLCGSILAVVALGFALGNCGGGDGGGECKRTADCTSKYGANYYCDLNSKTCVCAPQCTGKCCGDDGCGSTCADNCPTGTTCDANCECVGGGDCTNGQTQCSGALAQTCQNESWVTTQDCAATGATCVNGVCQGGTCTNGEYRCNGNVSEVCANLAWTVDETCTGGETCAPATGRCEAAGCTENDTRCNGNIVQTCTGGAWVNGQDCVAIQQVCSAGTCIDQGQTHPGAGDNCKCEAADSCSVPCPADAGSANVCITIDAEGNGFCSFECLTTPDCVADFVDGCCEDVGGMACLPTDYCPGSNTEGDPCEFDINDDGLIINAGTGNCVDGLVCLGIDADPVDDPCAVDGDCAFQANWNPDCAGGGCGVSFCAAYCGAGDTCPAGFDPIPVGQDCFCAPGTPAGNQTQGELCGPTPGNCIDGLDCVQFQGATNGYCTGTCNCEDGTGCTAPTECMFTNQAQDTCWCGYLCPGASTTECPDTGNGWECVDIGDPDPIYACLPL